MKITNFTGTINDIFQDNAKKLLAFICYQICHASAMRYAKLWYEGTASHFLLPDVNLSSQRISDFLRIIGDEDLQRTI